MIKLKKILIEWIDASSVDDWITVDSYKKSNYLQSVSTLGFLIQEDKTSYVVALNYGEGREGCDDVVSCSIAIPKSCVIKKKFIR